MKKIIVFLFVSMSLMGQTVIRSNELNDEANVFYDPSYTLFDLFSDEPIFPDSFGYYNIIISSNENKSAQRFIGTSQQLSRMAMYKFKNLETHGKWARGEVAVKKQPNESQYGTTRQYSSQDLKKRTRSQMEEMGEQNEIKPIQPLATSVGFTYFDGLIDRYKTSEIIISNPQAKDKYGNYLWGDINGQNRDGFGILYSPNQMLRIGEFIDMKLEGPGLTFSSNGLISIGNFKANEITGIGFKGYYKDSTRFLENVKEILKHNTNNLLNEKNFAQFQIGTYFRNEKNESVFDGKSIQTQFEEKSDLVKSRFHIIGRRVNSIPQGTVKLIIENPPGSSMIQGIIVHTGKLDTTYSPKGDGFQYSISPGKYVRLSGEFKGFFEVDGSREHSNGMRHYGLIKNDNMVGEARMEQEGKVITGMFQDFIPYGNVRIDFKNGDYFEGSFMNGAAQGQGVYYYAEPQEKISGNFTNGRPNGKMKVTKDQKITIVTYVDGKKE